MSSLPPALNELVDALALLPGVGPRSAERYAYSLLKRDPSVSKRLASALDNLHNGVSYCKTTYALIPSGEEYSRLYTDPSRDKQQIAVVAEPFDILALEKTNSYQGTYHVLGGLISPIDNISPSGLSAWIIKILLALVINSANFFSLGI